MVGDKNKEGDRALKICFRHCGFWCGAADALGDISHYNKMVEWRDNFEARMLNERDGITVFGKSAPRLGNTSCIAAAGKAAEAMIIAFDLAGVAISAGAACSSGKVKSSHVLEAMGAGECARRPFAFQVDGQR